MEFQKKQKAYKNTASPFTQTPSDVCASIVLTMIKDDALFQQGAQPKSTCWNKNVDELIEIFKFNGRARAS